MELVMLVGPHASAQHIYTISEFLLAYAHLNYEMDFVDEQANASIHTSQETSAFFEEQDGGARD